MSRRCFGSSGTSEGVREERGEGRDQDTAALVVVRSKGRFRRSGFVKRRQASKGELTLVFMLSEYTCERKAASSTLL